MKTLGEKVKELRILSGYSQEELADEIGVSRRTIQRIENGEHEVKYYILFQLASFFGIATDYLFGFVEKENILWMREDIIYKNSM